jgi:LacI family transcriptional regulator
MRVAKRLRYVPNGAARSLTTNQSHTLGVLLPDLYGEFFSEVIRGIDQAARSRKYHLLVSSSHNDVAELEAALRAMAGRVDGLVVMSPDIDAASLEANLPAGLPVVLMNCLPGNETLSTITVDNYGGAYAMVRHLIEHGHEHVAILRGAEGNCDAEERLRGYRDALTDAGLPTNPALEFAGDFTERSGYEAVRDVLATDPRPTVLFASNDSMAIGALRALREAGVRVPDEMAVAGFDDIPVAQYVSPALSSVHVAIHDMGRQAIEALLANLDNGAETPSSVTLPTRLVLRESCGTHV